MVIVQKRSRPISNIPLMSYGSSARDGGHLFLNKCDRDMIIEICPSSKKYIKRSLGSEEFINDISQWCLWIKDDQVEEAVRNPFIKERLKLVASVRKIAEEL